MHAGPSRRRVAFPKSTVAAILCNSIYTGRFDWGGKSDKTCQGRYEAIVPLEW